MRVTSLSFTRFNDLQQEGDRSPADAHLFMDLSRWKVLFRFK